MKIITGIGRSGTSLLAEYCKQIGLNIGNAKWIDEYRAGNEDKNTIEINNILYKHWPEAESKCIKDIRQLDRDVVKDPHFFKDTKILTTWLKARSDIEVVWCRRDPEEIVESQKKLANMTCPAYRCFEDLIRVKEKEFEAFFKQKKVKYYTLWYPDFKDQYYLVQNIFGGKKKIWDKIVK